MDDWAYQAALVIKCNHIRLALKINHQGWFAPLKHETYFTYYFFRSARKSIFCETVMKSPCNDGCSVSICCKIQTCNDSALDLSVLGSEIINQPSYSLKSLFFVTPLQARALTAQIAETDAIRFLVGTQSLKFENQVRTEAQHWIHHTYVRQQLSAQLSAPQVHAAALSSRCVVIISLKVIMLLRGYTLMTA